LTLAALEREHAGLTQRLHDVADDEDAVLRGSGSACARRPSADMDVETLRSHRPARGTQLAG